jgi:hypothetical protein
MTGKNRITQIVRTPSQAALPERLHSVHMMTTTGQRVTGTPRTGG